ncbi:MAG: hypothetical protein DSY33_04555 [Archaeoglobus sp.]|nr:MAG: hypothetical protein DSY33_04555 [Archaeoglobus sp.]
MNGDIGDISSMILYEIMNIRTTKNIDDFGEEILDKCSRLLRARRAYLKISLDGYASKHFPLGFRSWVEAEKTINLMKDEGCSNCYIYEFDYGIFFIELSEEIDQDWSRTIYLFSKRIEEVVNKIASEYKIIEVEKLMALINSIPDAVVVIDETGKVVEINNYFIKISKISPSEIIGKRIYKLPCFNGEDQKMLNKAVEDLKRGKPRKLRIVLDNVYFEINSAKIYNTNKFVLIFRDVTELEITNEKLQTLVNCLRSFIFMKDINLNYILVNDAFARFVGLPKNKIVGKKDEDILPPELAKACRKTDLEVLKTGSFSNFKVSINHGGKTLFFEGYKIPVIKSGKIVSIVGVIRDITEKIVVEELKRFRTLLDYSSDAVFIVDEFDRIVDLNKEAEKWVEECKKHGRCDSIRDVILGSWDSELFEGFVAESYKIVSVNVKSATFGNQRYKIVIARDITNLKKTQEKVKEMNEQLKLINSLLRHDINNNITAITTFLEVYKETGDIEYINKIEKILDNCIELINNIKEVESALYEDRGLSCINIKNIISKVVDAIKNNNVYIKVNVDDCFVVADEFIYSVFENLLNNAVIHNDEDYKMISIESKCYDDYIEIRIADNGPGIPDEVKDEVFKKGFKFGSSGRTGIGLYLVKSLMEKYGGSVELKDNKPRGSLFILRFRRCKSGKPSK